MNLNGITKRIEALEEQREADKPWIGVRRIWQDGKLIGGYSGPITADMLVIERVIITPPVRG